MITGAVIGSQALVAVTFRLDGLPGVAIEFVVDTGFAGALALPSDAVSLLGLPFYQEIKANLADDRDVDVDAHRATIEWNGKQISVAVLSMGKRPLLGTALLNGCVLSAEFVENGYLQIERA